MLTIGSLFSGIGGLEYGLEAGLAAAGVPTRTLWQVEQDDYARAVLARHWPHAERYTDVRNITASSVAPVDLLCGGFPCQDISTAGKGAGLAGERSGLFFEMARLICELQPRIAVLENVSAINTRGLDVVLGTLAALGYDARWGGLRASEVGAPHRRERWFCVAWLADTRQRSLQLCGEPGELRCTSSQAQAGEAGQRQRQREGAGCGGQALADHAPLWQRCDCCENYWCNRHEQHAHDCPCPSIEHLDIIDPYAPGSLADSISHRLQGQQPTRPAARAAHRTDRAGEWRQAEPGVGRNVARVPRGLVLHRWPAPPGPQYAHEPPRTRPRQPHDRERLRALGNAVVPQCAAVVGRWIADELLTTL